MRMTRLIALLVLMLCGCVDSLRAIGTYRLPEDDGAEAHGSKLPYEDAGQRRHELRDGGINTPSRSDAAELNALIAHKNRPETKGRQARREDIAAAQTFELGIPPAPDNMGMSSKQCLAALEKRGVAFETPLFDTHLIETPVLLAGPVDGVRIGPHFQGKKKPTHAVMDCHLALAMSGVAQVAKRLGIAAIEFYSTYRPLKRPPKKCPKRAGRKKCLEKKRNYRKVVAAQKSQHRFGRAVDIRWLEMADGSRLDVLEHFERRDGVEPCSYSPASREAAVLTAFVCTIHRAHVFSVMLTPNANRDHHNHFHFDLTPRARFNILR